MNIEIDDSSIDDELKKLGYWNEIYSKKNYFGTGPTILALFAKELIDKYSISEILELGCGQGRDSIYFADLNCNVTATDISENAINFVKQAKNELNLENLKLYVHDTLNPLDFDYTSFDLVYSNLALQFFNYQQLSRIFDNIKKVMKDDSYLLFSTKKPGDKYFNFGNKIAPNSFEYKGITRFFFTKPELETLLQKSFTIISFEEDSHVNDDKTISVWWKILVKK
jgi:SAM-dependent methyltransferase